MHILVAYASRHGATRGIAERIAATLQERGLDATLRPADEVGPVSDFDGFVIGSAAYAGHWLSPASDLVRRNVATLGGRPVWLFSSGPVGTETVDAKGRDVLEASEPQEFAEFAEAIHPRDRRVVLRSVRPGRRARSGPWSDSEAGSCGCRRSGRRCRRATSATGRGSRHGPTGIATELQPAHATADA